jgi:DNA-directed RNA polymerase subunit RPC12/RpoP
MPYSCYDCDHCGYKFALGSNAYISSDEFSGDEMLMCLECGTRFTLKGKPGYPSLLLIESCMGDEQEWMHYRQGFGYGWRPLALIPRANAVGESLHQWIHDHLFCYACGSHGSIAAGLRTGRDGCRICPRCKGSVRSTGSIYT